MFRFELFKNVLKSLILTSKFGIWIGIRPSHVACGSVSALNMLTLVD